MKSPKGFKGKYFSLAAITATVATVTLQAQTASTQQVAQASQEYTKEAHEEDVLLEVDEAPVVVISKKIVVSEAKAPFATEIYTKSQIERSRAKNIYDFLNSQTSLNAVPHYGNPFAQKLDLRGFGAENGYQNVVVTVNGRRLNNIDMSPQLLASIPLETVDKIEILKGSGSVEYGDGATAGVVNIVTKEFSGASAMTYLGSGGRKFGSLMLGIEEEYFSLSGFVEEYRQDGFKTIGSDGKKDEASSTNKGFKASVRPIEDLSLSLGAQSSKMRIFYPNALTLEEYKNNPKTVPAPSWGTLYNEQYYTSDVLSYGLDYALTQAWKVSVEANQERKTSEFVTYGSRSRYHYDSYGAKLSYGEDNLKAVLGGDLFDGDRKGGLSTTTKKNQGAYAKADYSLGQHTFSSGVRDERVRYTYKDTTSHLERTRSLNAYDVGYSFQLDSASSFFANYNHGFQAPDIDRFFAFGGGFNGFIDPMKTKTFNVGYRYKGYPFEFKTALFHARVDNEIYYDASTWTNTNFDQTKKQGVELSGRYQIMYNVYSTLNYAYVKSEITKDANAAIIGNETPGVARHNAKIAFTFQPTFHSALTLSHHYKSGAYAADDIDHSFGKMEAYHSIDLSGSYRFKQYEFFAQITNLFDRSNAVFADNGFSLGVYPVNYERRFLVGVKATF